MSDVFKTQEIWQKVGSTCQSIWQPVEKDHTLRKKKSVLCDGSLTDEFLWRFFRFFQENGYKIWYVTMKWKSQSDFKRGAVKVPDWR